MYIVYLNHDTNTCHVATYQQFKAIENSNNIEYIAESKDYEIASSLAQSLKVITF